MVEALLALAAVAVLAGAAGLAAAVFSATRALVVGERSRWLPGFDLVWVVTALTAVFGAAMGVVVVGRQFSKKGDMLF